MKKEQTSRAVTIKDVAKMANVSITTVSRVLNNNDYFVSEKTKKHVLEVMEELKYRPNALARGLQSSSTKTIGLIIQDISNPYYPKIVQSIESRAQLSDYSVILANSGRSEEKIAHYLEIMWERRVDGLIVVGSSIIKGAKKSQLFQEREMKTVVIGKPFDKALHSVQIDNGSAVREMCRNMIEMGHRRISMITGSKSSATVSDREKAFRQALEEAGLPVIPEYIVRGDFTFEGGIQAVDQLPKIGGSDGVTAIFAQNDLMAIGVMKALERKGYRIPRDVSVVGFDDIEAASFVTPALSTVSVPMERLGEVAMEALEKLLSGDKVPRTQKLHAHIEMRESLAPPKELENM